MIELPQFLDSSFQIDGNIIDCANGEEGRIDISLNSGTAPSEVGVQASSTDLISTILLICIILLKYFVP